MGVYAIVQVCYEWLHSMQGKLTSGKNFNIPLQLQPEAFSALSLISWAQILIYNKYAPTVHVMLATAYLYQRMANMDRFTTNLGCCCHFWWHPSTTRLYTQSTLSVL